MSPQFLTLGQVDFITVGSEGSPEGRTFYLQAGQGDMVISVIIEKGHAAALSLAIDQLLGELGGLLEDDLIASDMRLRQPIQPLFQVASLGLGYNTEVDALVVVARAPVAELDEQQDPPEIHLWGSRAQMLALSERAAEVVTDRSPRCPLCDEPLEPGEDHACPGGNGRKWLYRLEE